MTDGVVYPEHKTLQDAQLAIMADVPYIKKGTSPGLRYTYAGEADLIAKLHPAMRRHRVTVCPESVEVVSETEYATASGTRMVNVRATVGYVFRHGDDQQYVAVLAEAADSGDKAAAKLMTSALKYALRQFFLIETGDDPDATAHQRAAVADLTAEVAHEKIDAATTIEELDKFRKAAAAKAPGLRSEIDLMIARRKRELENVE